MADVWKKSSRCDSVTCVEVNFVNQELVIVRDSKNPNGNILTIVPNVWMDFIASLKDGELNLL